MVGGGADEQVSNLSFSLFPFAAFFFPAVSGPAGTTSCDTAPLGICNSKRWSVEARRCKFWPHSRRLCKVLGTFWGSGALPKGRDRPHTRAPGKTGARGPGARARAACLSLQVLLLLFFCVVSLSKDLLTQVGP